MNKCSPWASRYLDQYFRRYVFSRASVSMNIGHLGLLAATVVVEG